MSFDGVVTRAIVHELQPLVGGRIHKIYQPQARELTLHIRAERNNYTLCLSAHPSYPRLHLTETKAENPAQPPTFCMLLRKYCEGGMIQAITQNGLERVVHLDITGRNELGDQVTRRLVIELMGRHSNVILYDPTTEKIADSLVHVGHHVSQVRQVLPGLTYTAPPTQNKRDPLTVDEPTFIAGFDYNGGQIARQIVARFTGIGPQLATEIVHRAGLGNRAQLWHSFTTTMQAIRAHDYQPMVLQTADKALFAARSLTYATGEAVNYATMNACIDHYFTSKAQRDHIKQQTSDLRKLLQNELAKNEKKVRILDHELTQIEQAEQWRIYGELLMASLYQLKRGDRELVTVNFYEPDTPEITIPLDPARSPVENAERYFKKYNKLKTARTWNRKQKQQAQQDIAYLESILVQLQSLTPTEIEQIREELIEAGLLKHKATSKRKKPSIPTPLKLTASNGTPIWVGKNNKQNDYLTHRLAVHNETWLHTKEIPGSHVVIKSRDVNEQTLQEAAMLAAYFSKARESAQVPVDYTLVKYVKKIPGGPLGFVTYTQQQTIYITPEAEIIEQWLAQGSAK